MGTAVVFVSGSCGAESGSARSKVLTMTRRGARERREEKKRERRGGEKRERRDKRRRERGEKKRGKKKR